MRLIDADKLNEEWKYTIRFGITLTEVENLKWIVNKQKEIEAIPIEFIKEWIKEETEFQMFRNTIVELLIYDWEKENEIERMNFIWKK